MPKHMPSSDKTQSLKRSDQDDSRDSNDSLDNRHIIRQMIVQRLYETDYQSDHITEKIALEADYEDTLEFYTISPKLARKLRKGEETVLKIVGQIRKSQKKIDAMITKHAPAWPLSQINKVDLQIIRLAILEGFMSTEVAPRIAIDEAIELARDFGGESDIKFVSGVLGSIYNEANSKSVKSDKKKLKEEK